MITSIKNSELILNSDGSVYHLHLKPKDLAYKVITVGDPDRVDQVSAHFDTIDFRQHKREFKTHTGTLRNQRITVISTGIGSDNIDIVLNELDALVNIDFESRNVKSELTSLKIVRIGTSGALQNEIPVDSFLLSTHGLDLNGMLQAYKTQSIQNKAFEQAFVKHSNWKKERAQPVLVEGNKSIENQGIMATCGGFYASQGRKLRLTPSDSKFLKNLQNFTFKGFKITNFEMETSAIFGLSKLLGHQACSMNAILANRTNGTFSKSPEKTIDALIQYTLDKLID